MARLSAAVIGLALSLGACGGLQLGDERGAKLGAAEQQQLDSSLSVASASAKAGQVAAAERLYTELARQFPHAPEPRLGRAYLALRSRDFTRAGKLFAEANERAATPAARAEALLGAGRASLGLGDTAAAKKHFLAASKLAKGTPVEAWVANGLGVVATIEGDPARARTRYEEALESAPSHPLITANLVRALAQSGEESEARRLFAKYPASYWLEGDGTALSRLLKETDTEETDTEVATVALGAKVQLFSARSRAGALAAWGRLFSEERDLLGSLNHRVVKVEFPERGVFYRLRAGPLADKAAAKRLCSRLKQRGRDCLVLSGKWTGSDQAKRSAMTAKDAAARSGVPANAAAASGAKVQLFSARSRAGALAAWGRLFSEERDLLGSLDHRVVKVEFPKRGVFHRLRAGPLADKTAAKRLCSRLKQRGRDCLVLSGKWTGGDQTKRSAVTVKDAAARSGVPANAAAASGAKVQLYSGRSRAEALAAWTRLSSEEKDLLGSLTHRVVKADIPGKGVFYRLRVEPLADKAAARRLCGLLRGRGRDCFVPAGK